MKRKIKH